MTTTPSQPPLGALPQSQALSEADSSSLAELMSRDPEGFQRQDRDRIISALRADRERRAQAEATAATSGGKKPKAIKLGAQPSPGATADKLGL